MAANGEVRRHLFIEGKVQGVFFRESAREHAEAIGGLKGYVRNLSDGRVEAVVQGPVAKVESLVEFCRTGPPRAKVASVDEKDEDPVAEEKGFRVVR